VKKKPSAMDVSGDEPGLGGHRRRGWLTGQEPALGGDRRFDRIVWNRLLTLDDQETVIFQLSTGQCQSYIDPLLQVLQPDATHRVTTQESADWNRQYDTTDRVAALRALGQLGNRLGKESTGKITEQVLPLLTDTSRERVIRSEAARTLGLLGHPAAEDILLQAASLESDIHWAAIESLGQMGTERALAYLYELLGEEEALSITDLNAVLTALGKAGAKAEETAHERIFELLMTRFIRGEPLVRAAAAAALGGLGDDRALDSLIQTAIFARYTLQESAIQALGLMGNPQAALALVGLLATSGHDIRQIITEALARLGPAAATPVLPLLQHHAPQVRCDAAYVLGRLQARQAAAQLIELVKDPDARVREVSAHSLGIIGDPSAVEPLMSALKDPVAAVRKEAALILGSFRDRRAVGPLCLALWDLDATVRWFAAYSLGVIGDKRAISSLCRLLNDPFKDAALAASDALVNIGKASIPALMECAETRAEPAHHLARQTLERLGETG
jgi:HEAT repeat protein